MTAHFFYGQDVKLLGMFGSLTNYKQYFAVYKNMLYIFEYLTINRNMNMYDFYIFHFLFTFAIFSFVTLA